MSDREESEGVRETVRTLLGQLGEDPQREGLKDTPKRVARMWHELLSGYGEPPSMTAFPKDEDGLDADQMVVVSDIDFWSTCEHHMVPFIGKAHIGYLPGDKVVGLSKLARVVRHFAARLQVQERLTAQVAEYMYRELEPIGVCVILSAEHLCMSMRGVRSPGHQTTTHAIRGNIDKLEVLRLINLNSSR